MWHRVVEGAARFRDYEEKQDEERHQGDEDRAAREKNARQRVLAVRRETYLGEHARKIELELVRRRVLAGVEARAAVVAEVGEIVDVGLGKVEPPLERGEHRAIALAVA